MKFKDIFKHPLSLAAVIAAPFTAGASLTALPATLAAETAYMYVSETGKATKAAIDEQAQAQERLIRQQKQAELEVQQQTAKIYGSPVEIIPQRSDEVTPADLEKIQGIMKPLQDQSQETKVIQDRQATAIQDLGNFLKDISKSAFSTYYDVQTLKAQSRPAEFKRLSTAEGASTIPAKESDITDNIKKYLPVAVIIIILFVALRKKRG